MKKIFTLFAFLALFGAQLNAQMAPGSIVPNFTGTDINGNTWELYELLDQGKTVVIDVSATWCGPCWNYHNTHALENLYNTYGPNGTDEMMVLWIEGDPSTGMADLLGQTAASQGNWVEGTPFPIIDDAAIGDILEITYFPTIYHVCPNRIINEIGQVGVDALYAANGDCLYQFGDNNAGILKYEGFTGTFCDAITFAPSAKIQNLGLTALTSATLDLIINGNLVEQIEYAGNLATYNFADVEFSEVTLIENSEIEIRVSSVNGVADEDTSNDATVVNVNLGPEIDRNNATVEVRTDQYGVETYWELLDGNGNALASGGNPGIFTGDVAPGAYSGNTTYTQDVLLPADGCFEFKIYDAYGDGICCSFGNGSYSLITDEGETLFTGAEFGAESAHPFEVFGASTINNSARIVTYTGESGVFCLELTYAPEILIQNSGANEITSAVIEVLVNGVVVQTYTWTGSITTGNYANVTLDEITLTDDADVDFVITTINGEADEYADDNSYSTSFFRSDDITNEQVLTMEVKGDQYAYETFWYIKDDAGNVIASGGNTVVGPNGGGARVATAGNPGAYAANSLNTQQVTLPVDACYEVVVVDDWGDGICCQYGNGYYRLKEPNGTIVASGGTFTDYATSPFAYQEAVSVPELTEVSQLNLFPNPVSSELMLQFDLSESMPLQISIYNALGQNSTTAFSANYNALQHTVRIDASAYSNGLYYVTLQSDEKGISRKFAVTR
ncbi:MAG: T9SS type A sorting domain-containing protein [Saprospiraceae bacterium]|nr:T9SS type A sorting domain-containing protein [Saprospiraceae bacterium]